LYLCGELKQLGFKRSEWDQSAPRRNPGLQLQNPNRCRKVEPAGPGTSRIHHGHDYINERQQWSVGVSEDENLRVGECGMELVRIRDAKLIAVSDDDVESIELERGHLGQPASGFHSVRVSVHSRHRRDCLELDEQVQRPHVSRVENVIHLGKGIEDFGPQKAVRIRNHTEPHGSGRLARPAPGDLDVELEMIEDPLDDEVDQLSDLRGPVVETGRCGNHDGTRLGDGHEVA
jgi:hypothetical protein